MKSKLKTFLLTILLILSMVCAMLFCTAFPAVNSASADIAPVETMGDTHVIITADKTTITAGDEVKFTLLIVSSRLDMEWYSVMLALSPLDADLHYPDKEICKYLSLVDSPSVADENYMDVTFDRFSAASYGAEFQYVIRPIATPVKAYYNIEKTFTVKFAEDMPDTINSITFGFANIITQKVTYSKNGVYADGITDQVKKSVKSGQLTYEPITIEVEHCGDTHVKITADKTAVYAGGEVTVTLTVTSTRYDMEWCSVNLIVSPMDSDLNKVDKEICQYLSLGDNPSVSDENYIDLTLDKFALSYGVVFQYAIRSVATPTNASVNIEKTFTVKIAEDLPDTVTSITFGLFNSIGQRVVYSKNGVWEDGITDQAKKTSKTGQLTHTPVTIEVTH